MNLYRTVPLDSSEINRTTPVRVQCEAPDCGALLEVNLNPGQRTDKPLIIRCGNCVRLLEVNLAQTEFANSFQYRHPSTALTENTWTRTTGAFCGGANALSFSPDDVLASRLRTLRQRRTHQGVLKRIPSRLPSQSFIQPPPLIRYSLTQQNAIMKSLSGLPFDSSSPHWSSSLGGPGIAQRPEFILTDHFLEQTKSKREKSNRMRNPSPYNHFMSHEVKRIKSANPLLDHKEAFKMAANNWAKSPNNCNNRRMLSPFTAPPLATASMEAKDTASVVKSVEETSPSKEELELEWNTTKTTAQNFKRRVADLNREDSANTEDKRRKTGDGFMDDSETKSRVLEIVGEKMDKVQKVLGGY